MPTRAYCDKPIDPGQLTLTGAEAHHLVRVLRVQVGDTVILFDGNGAEHSAEVQQCHRDRIVLAVGDPRAIDRELSLRLVLGVTLPKGERQRWLVERAVELGVQRLVPLTSERSVARPTQSTLARLRRYTIEASKQCGRNRLMEVVDAVSWPEWASAAGGRPGWFLHPGGLPVAPLAAGLADWRIAVGPEGGWSPEECQLARDHDWQTIGLGPRTLRIETAALAAVSWLAANAPEAT